jgi:hypothetical protein
MCDPIAPDYTDLKQTIANMFETMYNAYGVGLAAPQVGLPIRLFVIDTTPFSDDEDLENDIEVFDETIKDILNSIGSYVNLPKGIPFDEEHIKNVDIDYTIEKGTKNNQLHIHIMLKFRHKTRIQLNYQKIKTKITKDLGLKNIYLNNRLIRNSGSENILDYLNKYTNIS